MKCEHPELVEHQISVRLRVHHQLLLGGGGGARSLVPLAHQQVNDHHVQHEEAGGNDDQPKRVADVGLAVRGPASVSDLLSLEDVVLKLHVELNDPRDHGHQAGERSQRVPKHQAWK